MDILYCLSFPELLSDIFIEITDTNLLTLKSTLHSPLPWILSSPHKESSLICLPPTQIHPSFMIQIFSIITCVLVDLFLCSLTSIITQSLPFLYKVVLVPSVCGSVFITSQQLTPKPLGNKF